MMWGANEGMGWWMVFGTISWLIFLGVIVYIFTRLFPRDAGQHEHTAPGTAPESAIEIARRRYALGEISEEEFRRIRDQLSH